MPLSRSSLVISAALALTVLSGCVSEDSGIVLVAPSLDSFGREYPENFAAAGRQLAVENCASCHAIDNNSISPNRNAPPMNTAAMMYTVVPAWAGISPKTSLSTIKATPKQKITTYMRDGHRVC